MINYKKEAQRIVQEYSDKFHVLFTKQQAAEDLVQYAFMQGYSTGLDFILNNKPKN